MLNNLKRTVLKNQSAQALLFFLLLTLVFASLSPRFLTLSNGENIITAISVVGLLAIGATFVIGAGGIDLSSGSVVALSGVVGAWLAVNTALPGGAILVIAVIVGILAGLISGLIINLTSAPSFIITLGMLSVLRAIGYIISDASPIYGLREDVVNIGQGSLIGIAAPVWFLFLASAVAWIVLRKTRFGQHLLVFGDNPASTEAMGVEVNKLKLLLYGFAGFYSGLAGFLFMCRTSSGDPTAGQGYELIGITAVILGGANLFGGRASIVGTLSGVLCLGVLQNGLNLLSVGTYYQVLFMGVVLIGSTFLARLGGVR